MRLVIGVLLLVVIVVVVNSILVKPGIGLSVVGGNAPFPSGKPGQGFSWR